MSVKKRMSKVGENLVNRGRHEHQCRICSHPKRDEIEQAFIAWVSPSQIAKKYSVTTVYLAKERSPFTAARQAHGRRGGVPNEP